MISSKCEKLKKIYDRNFLKAFDFLKWFFSPENPYLSPLYVNSFVICSGTFLNQNANLFKNIIHVHVKIQFCHVSSKNTIKLSDWKRLNKEYSCIWLVLQMQSICLIRRVLCPCCLFFMVFRLHILVPSKNSQNQIVTNTYE